jgi:hypothetical protein
MQEFSGVSEGSASMRFAKNLVEMVQTTLRPASGSSSREPNTRMMKGKDF